MGQLTVLFCGATGRLTALTELLLDRDHRVVATTRDPAAAAARRLRAQGARLVQADFDDERSLSAAMSDVDAVVAAGTAHAAGPAGDVRHGRAIVDAAAAAGVGHLVYLTVAGADRPTGVPIIDSKHAVEQHLRGSDVPYTIVAPAYFMENLWNPWNAAHLAHGRLPWPVSPARAVQQIPIADTLAFTVHALEHRDALLGRRIEIASDELSGEQAAAALSDLLGRQVPLAPPGTPNPLFAWLERTGTHVDIAALRQAHPIRWHTFADWARTQDWRRLTTPTARQPRSTSSSC